MLFKKLRSFKRDYFTLTRRETRGNIILLVILLLQLTYLIISRNFNPEPIPSRITYVEFPPTDKIKVFDNKHITTTKKSKQSSIKVSTSFDPNKTSVDAWITMGFDKRIAQRIVKYRNHGGRFNEAEDLLKIYGMKKGDFRIIAPYILISSPKKIRTHHEFKSSKPEKRIVLVELNNATPEELELLPQIGYKRAQRIVKYRNLLGGYILPEQLLEVYSIDTNVFDLIKNQVTIDTTNIHKILINSIKEDSIYHPYLNRRIIKRIISYRKNHGLFADKSSVCRAGLINDKLCGKIAPYLKLE